MINSPKQPKDYQFHLQGMRAFAILFIIWFHFTQNNGAANLIPSMPNGFLGVEIFMVIMGYLLIKGYSKPDVISVRVFLTKRALRLLPTFGVTVFLTMLVGIFILDFEENLSMGRVGLASLLGYANIELREITSGYFAADATSNPFLHTWYIAVILQLLVLSYICYRILILMNKRWIVCILFIMAVLSFIYGNLADILSFFTLKQVILPWEVSYYDTFPRVWQILAGGSVLLLPDISKPWVKRLLVLAAGGCCLVPILVPFDTNWVLPVIVVVGAVLLVRYATGTFIGTILESAPLVKLGNISYSLYLIHMPLFVLYKAWFFSHPSDIQILMLIIISILIGSMMWRCVEKRRVWCWLMIILWGASLVLCGCCVALNGFKDFINKESNNVSIEYHHLYPWKDEFNLAYSEGLDIKELEPAFFSQGRIPLKRIGAQYVAPVFVVIGDSHMYHTCIGLDKLCEQWNVAGLMLDSIIVPFWNRKTWHQDNTPFYNSTRNKINALFAWLKAHNELKTVVICQNGYRCSQFKYDWDDKPVTSISAEPFVEFVKQLKKLDKRIVVIEPTPHFKSRRVLPYIRWRIRHSKVDSPCHPEYVCSETEYLSQFQTILQAYDELEQGEVCDVIRLRRILFRNGQCFNIQNGKAFCGDSNHITIPFAQKLFTEASPQLKSILDPQTE